MTDNYKENDKKYIVGTYNRFDAVLVEGTGATCIDENGKEYVDLTSGIGVNALGYCNDDWVAAVAKQLTMIQHTSNLYYTKPQVELAKRLVERTGLDKVFFCNSGAEANEVAIKTARKYRDHEVNKIVTLRDSFHGRTMATITATGQEAFHKHFTPLIEGFDYCDANDTDMLESLIDEDTCAIMIELIQGEGGVVNLEEDFVLKAAKLAGEKDVLLIVDEVQSGGGRTGKLFAYEHFGIKPDIVTFAKGIGGGLPIGGAIFSSKCSDVLKPGDHGTTFGGNPVVCAGAVKVLDTIDDKLLDEVAAKGKYIRERVEDFSKVTGTTGMGLMIGISLDGIESKDAANLALEKGLMVLTAKEKLRLLPPLTITYHEIDRGLDILKTILG